ncbi:MAG: MFS transporter, partial [Clostridia bacterium]|nr:MFS transporter [Clostridia bacterium]
MSILKKQLNRLLTVSALSSFQLAGASWVALLAARGFTLVEIGLAESCFHLASLLFEVPSGVISDVFGRKKSMVLSQLMFVLSAIGMAFSNQLAGVCLALVLDAWGYNFASGAREALAYDSMKEAGQADKYMDFSSRELSIYRLGNAAAILCAGLALMIGHRAAYILDASLALVGMLAACGLKEIQTEEKQFEGTISGRILRCFR